MIQTERLCIRRFRPEDLDDFVALIRDKMASEYAPYDTQWPTDRESLEGALLYFAGDEAWHAVVLKNEDRVIGFLVTGLSEDGKESGLGYTLHSVYHRKGYAYEACRAVMDAYHREKGIARFTAGTADCNTPSVGLLHKLGFVWKRSVEASFAQDTEGNPITFTGGYYECPMGDA